MFGRRLDAGMESWTLGLIGWMLGWEGWKVGFGIVVRRVWRLGSRGLEMEG